MTHHGTTAASATTALSPPETDADERSIRARTERMAVRPFGPSLYEVDSESGNSYVVDVRAGQCTCPDHMFRDVRCKHLRRVAIEITEGRVPAPGEIVVGCAVCDRELFVEEAAEGPHLCAIHDLGPGDRVRDRETGRRLLVVAPPARTAATVAVPDASTTVAGYPGNEPYPEDDPVVGAVYPPARITRRGAVPDQLQVYAFPLSRLERVDG